MPKPKKGRRVSSNTEGIPERVDVGVEGSNNARPLSATHTQRWSCMGDRVQQRNQLSELEEVNLASFRNYISNSRKGASFIEAQLIVSSSKWKPGMYGEAIFLPRYPVEMEETQSKNFSLFSLHDDN